MKNYQKRQTEPVQAKPFGFFRDPFSDGLGQGPALVNLPGGRFRMGDIQGTGYSDERPVHDVDVARFAIGVYLRWTGFVTPSGTFVLFQVGVMKKFRSR